MTTILTITHFLFLLLFLPREDVLVGAQIVYRRIVGAELTVKCLFNFVGNTKVFCKEPCDVANALGWLPGKRIVGGPFSFQFTEGQTGSEVSVTFRRLTKADSALYRCGLIGQLRQSMQQFKVIVVDGSTGRRQNPQLLTTTTMTAQAGPTTEFTTADRTSDMENVWLYVGVSLAAVLVLLGLSVLLYCRKRSSAAKDPPEEAEYDGTSQAHSVYQNIDLDRQRVEIFAVDSHAKTYNSTGSGVTTGNTVADNSATPTYSQLLFPQGSSGVVHGDGQQVVYAVPQTREPPTVQRFQLTDSR